jgi:hypothetical protein
VTKVWLKPNIRLRVRHSSIPKQTHIQGTIAHPFITILKVCSVRGVKTLSITILNV